MHLKKPTIKQIKSESTKQSFERGQDYYKDGSIIFANIIHDSISALVSGTEQYQVSISANIVETNQYCTCPYSFDGICKHIVAVLLHTADHFEQMIQDEKKRKIEINKLFLDISDKRLKEFLSNQMEYSYDLKEKFMDYFGKDYDTSPQDCKLEINLSYKRAAGIYGIIEYGNEINFEKFDKIAKAKEKKRDYGDAGKIYQEISEVISDNMDSVDDSDGYYGDCFSDAISNMTSCINLQTLTPKQKQSYISYMFEKYIKNDPDYFKEYYISALEQICTDKHDYTYWQSILEPHLPEKIPSDRNWSRHYNAKEKILMQIYILGKLKDKSLDDVFAMHYCNDSDICMQYIKYLQKNNSEKTPHIIEKGLKLYPKITELKNIAYKTYKKTDPRHHNILLELYFETLETKYYSMLKKLSGWDNTFDEIIKHFTKTKSHAILADIYLMEEMHHNALEHVISDNKLYMLVEYHKKLAVKYPKEYFASYRKLIVEFTKNKTDRHHYKDVKTYLRKIKTIPKHKKEFIKLVQLIREQNSTKPAFLDEIKNI